jgi:hypothetical protein
MGEAMAIETVGGQLPARDSGSVAREMARAHKDMLDHYRREMSLSDAERWARDGDIEQLAATPANQLTWHDLSRATGLDPERARGLWERALVEARDELVSGHRAAKAVESDGGPWERAQFVAVLRAFAAEWQPRGGIEMALVETLAQAYTTQTRWLARLTVLSNTEARRQDRETKERGEWSPPTVDAAAAIDQAAAMADRFNRLFARTLRSLRDLRRYSPHVTVQHVGQLNVAQSQVNISQTEPTTD